MPRVDEVRVDRDKLSQLLLVDCRLTASSIENRLYLAGTPVSHSVLHRMLGGPRGSKASCANFKADAIKAVLSLARVVLKRSEVELPLERVLCADSEATVPSEPTLGAFNMLKTDAIRVHQQAMAERHLAFKLYGQALCPLGPEAPLVVTRDDALKKLDSAEEITAPVRRTGTNETFIRGAPVIVLGEEGVGKTWLVAQWWLTRRPDDLVLFLPGPRFRGLETDTARILADSLLTMLEPEHLRNDKEKWRHQFETDDFAAAAQNQMLIIVDGLNEAPDTNWQIVIEALWQTAVRWGARLILTSRPAFWRRRRKDLAHWDCPIPAPVEIEGFNFDELSRACSLSGRDFESIPVHLRQRLCNPRIFRLAIQLLSSLRGEADLSIDRLLYAYWEQRQRDRPQLARIDPDRDVLLRGLARHAEEFHRRRLEAARQQGVDLAADAVGYDLDDLHQRFPGLSRYGALDGETASLLIGEIREGRFFDDDTLTPSASYVFRKESLAFALGLYLIEELTRTLREERPRQALDHLRERLDALIDPVLDFDQTADQVMAALTVACRDPDVSDLVAAVLLDQFLELRNRPPRMKPVLGGLALEAPSVFCGAAERALDRDDPERVDTWLTAALSDMSGAGAGLDTCSGWIVSPTEDEQPLCSRSYICATDAVRARRREKFVAMVLAGQDLLRFEHAFLDWALLATSKKPFGRPDKLGTPLARTFIAQLIRFNDRDPEALTDALLNFRRTGSGTRRSEDDCAVAVLLALIGNPAAVREAERIHPGVCGLVDPSEEFPQASWHLVLDPDADPLSLQILLTEARAAVERQDVDPYRPEGEAFRALAARCDPVMYLASVRASLDALIKSGPGESEQFAAPAKSMMSLAVESASTIAHDIPSLERMQEMLAIVAGSHTRVARDAEEEVGQVLATLMAIAPGAYFRELLLSVRWRQVNRGDGVERREFWRPVLPASLALDLVAEALSCLAKGDPEGERKARNLLEAISLHRFSEVPIDELGALIDCVLDAESTLDGLQPVLFEIVSKANGLGLARRVAASGWTADAATGHPLMRKISALLAERLAGSTPLDALARMVHPMDLPGAADGVTDEEMPALCGYIGTALAADRSGGPLPPTAAGAQRLLKFGGDWIAAHLKWHIWYFSVLIEGFSPTIDPFLAAMLTYGRQPVAGAADYLLKLLTLTKISRDAASFLLIRATLAVCLHETDRRWELLDNAILRITDDRVLAATAKAARELGPEHVAILRQYAAELAASGRAARIAYAIMLSAFLLLHCGQSQDEQDATFLGKVTLHARRMLKAHRNALFWADRRLSGNDITAEHLALCFPSAPFPGAIEDCALPTEADKLDHLFVFRFRAKADDWGFDTLFGLPSPPKWLSPVRTEISSSGSNLRGAGSPGLPPC